MAKQTFTWLPNAEDWSGEEEPKVLSIKFGDTYEQRIGNGINTQPNKFSVSFVNDYETSKEIRAFLRNHAGVTSFVWTNPYGETGLYIARSWSLRRVDNGIYSVSSTFEQVYD